MKKTYIEPTMIVVKLPERLVLANLSVSVNGTTNSGTADARSLDLDNEDF